MDIYIRECAVCHGESGEGGTGTNLQDSRLDLPAIVKIVVEGKGLMPAWGEGLSTAEIEEVSLYAKNLQQ